MEGSRDLKTAGGGRGGPMDSLHFEPYASTPRTPSPHDVAYAADFKQPLSLEPRIYEDDETLYAYCPRGSLLQELYEHDIEQQPQQALQYAVHDLVHGPPAPPAPHPVAHGPIVRRATFPYVRHDHSAFLYPEPISEEFHDAPAIKLEDAAALVVPSQSSFYNRAPPVPYLAHAGLHVQHTDDAASKETQYLRRRCFNCHTTEPPSWRRSTLNPGKIVCNKCGLYERTHLRPRPLRFDELRAGNKARTNKAKRAPSPKAVKKEPREYGLVRRSSVSSSSGSGASDWDDNGACPPAPPPLPC
ncbi:hypothetical protein C0993_009917 [Termitomyces sp. T159_Od127]|nr:hypothetical protein C0993_009917 [Termitomyces sp. T159_Od127]